MKVSWCGFLGKSHSWSEVAKGISRSIKNQGHEIDLFSTNGIIYLPEDLKQNIKGYTLENETDIVGSKLDTNYDIQLTYTCIKNSHYLSNGNKNRFLIWCYEFNGKSPLPPGFAKYHNNTDLILPPSQFAREVFLNSGIPDNKMKVIPHGINYKDLQEAIPYKFKTNKNTKIGVILGQIHRRKNLTGLLDMYGKAFSSKDDVCLVLKIQDRPATHVFELNFKDVFADFKNKYPKHAEVEIIREFIPNMYDFYSSCNIVFSASNCESFGMTQLESFVLGLINITPNYGGYLDFLNDQNSLLIDGKMFNVPANYLYWQQRTGLQAFQPDISDGVDKLRFAVANKEKLLEQYKPYAAKVKENYDWDHITKNILALTK
jgi:glycosyltransferase involved in cell wall biosynthesis